MFKVWSYWHVFTVGKGVHQERRCCCHRWVRHQNNSYARKKNLFSNKVIIFSGYHGNVASAVDVSPWAMQIMNSKPKESVHVVRHCSEIICTRFQVDNTRCFSVFCDIWLAGAVSRQIPRNLQRRWCEWRQIRGACTSGGWKVKPGQQRRAFLKITHQSAFFCTIFCKLCFDFRLLRSSQKCISDFVV